jgi:hypothetical protein
MKKYLEFVNEFRYSDFPNNIKRKFFEIENKHYVTKTIDGYIVDNKTGRKLGKIEISTEITAWRIINNEVEYKTFKGQSLPELYDKSLYYIKGEEN